MSKQVQTIEKTSKSVKIWILLSTIGIIVGVFEMFSQKNYIVVAHWILFTLGCLAVRIGISVARWWVNG